jgi:Ca2+-binding EF-hand superfamily protein
MHRRASLGLLLACALPLAAQAQVQRAGDYLSKMDADRDGRVSLAEYQDWLSYAFDAMDRDRDGVLSPAEQPGGRGEALTRAAYRARLAERFRKQDANRDGYLSARELAAPPQ